MTVERIPITDRASWLEMRKALLTASDIGAAAGKDPFKSPLRLYNEKLGLVPDVVENDIMRRGRWFEHAAVAALKEKFPEKEIKQPNIFLADADARLGATPDALLTTAGEFGVVNCQIKTVNRTSWEKWNGQPPLSYQLQTLAEGMLLDSTSNMLCVLVVDSHSADLVTYDIPRSPANEEKVRLVAKEFWRRVDNREPYPVDYSRDSDLMGLMFPQAVQEPVLDLSGDNLLPELLDERTGLGEAVKTAEERIKAIDTEIKAKMGEAAVAELPGWRITWKVVDRKGYTVEPRSGREFRVYPRKEKTT
jgi:putative phage-type endonuclease